jgi:hypothetical protein
MKTKLVYVLTSEVEQNYIEQALLSVFTARYYNPDACIVLITDDRTNELLKGQRGEILDYISEKIVVPLPEEMSVMLRSRQLKTSVRNLIEGDFLYIDCDTLITRPLNEIDNCSFEIGAVLESHLPIALFINSLYEKVEKNARLLGWSIQNEKNYFSSGVIYVKDTPNNQLFYDKWNFFWKEGIKKEVMIDQPSFAKTNIEFGYPVQQLNDRWNCVMYTHPLFDREAYILHFCSFRNMSYIFGEKFLEKIRQQGVKDNAFVQYSILHPYYSYLPFENAIYRYKSKDYIRMTKEIRQTAKLLKENLDFDDYIPSAGIYRHAEKCFKNKRYFLGSLIITLYKFYRVKFDKKFQYVENTCAIDNF